MSSFTLRAATPSDFDAVASILEASYHAAMDGLYPAEAVDAMCTPRCELLASGRYFLVEDSATKDAIGVGGWSPEGPTKSASGAAHMRQLGTLPDCGRRGVGRSIVVRCEVEARQAGVDVLQVYSSMCAEAFYASCGFRRLEDVDVRIGDTDVAVILMEKALT